MSTNGVHNNAATSFAWDEPVLFGGKEIRGRFVIPSGIRCTRASTIAHCFAEVPSIGIITTKSISFAPRAGYVEPIYARYGHQSYINAVGLSNPGAEVFARELASISIPKDKFLLVSIFGGDVKQFVQTAEALKSVADGFELNMSCPHAQGYGVEIGQNRELVAEITAAVAKATGLPVIVKLSAVVGDVGQTAKAAVAAGAAGITVTNTIGPATINLEGVPILSNKVGGLSGSSIQPLGLRAVRRVRDAIGNGPLIIGMGGISTADGVRDFQAAGADVFGVGSALTGMDSTAMKDFFHALDGELSSTTGARSPVVLPEIGMGYFKTRVVARKEYHPGLFEIVLDRLPIAGTPGELAGRYFFVMSPGVGEKPFAIYSAEQRSIVVRVAGRFTKHLATLQPGSELLLRGPYGRSFPSVQGRTVVLLGGGTGIASLYEIGRLLAGKNELHFLLGGRSKEDVGYVSLFSQLGSLELSTNDGSAGVRGFTSDLLAGWLTKYTGRANPLFVVCGPEPMVHACLKLLEGKARPEDIWGSIEYMTSCGVGICGKCACPTGRLTCIDGPFLSKEQLLGRSA